MGTTARRRAGALVLLALIPLAGCSSSEREATPAPSSSSSRHSEPSVAVAPVDPHASAKASVLAAYYAFWRVATSAEAHPRRRHPELAKFATDKALAAEQATLVLYRQQGIVGQGTPRLSPRVVAVATAGPQPSAAISDCLDLTAVDAVYRSTGKSAIAPGQSRRHTATAKATMYDGRWMIRELVANRKQPC
jgi:hypothetical protein